MHLTDRLGIQIYSIESMVTELSMAARRRKVAVVGLGSVAEPHLAAYMSLENVEVVGFVEPRVERRAEICARYEIAGFPSWESLMVDCRPDIACILTPASTHRDLTVRCAAAGVHVLCEKPMAVTLEDANAMASACAKGGVAFFYGSSYRFLPAVQYARNLISAGAIGNVRLITEQVIGGRGAAAYQALPAVHYPNGGPGGGGYGIVDHGIHMLDIFPWLCGSGISSILGRGDRSGGEPCVEFAVFHMRETLGLITYDGSTWSNDLPHEGVFSQGRQWLDGRGWMGDPGEWETGAGNIRVYGTEGSIRIFYYANKLYLSRSGKWQELQLPAGTAPWHFGQQMATFCANLDKGEPSSVSASDGIRALEALLAIYESESVGRWELLGGGA
jgi:UDP-N-acetyl-2-amino-2-deoxyglucuronate dehydrogenase